MRTVICMAGPGGIEPPTFGFVGRESVVCHVFPQLLMRATLAIIVPFFWRFRTAVINGAQRRSPAASVVSFWCRARWRVGIQIGRKLWQKSGQKSGQNSAGDGQEAGSLKQDMGRK